MQGCRGYFEKAAHNWRPCRDVAGYSILQKINDSKVFCLVSNFILLYVKCKLFK